MTDPAPLPPADPDLLDRAVAFAREAGALTLDWFRADHLAVERKGDGTPVTAADRAAERLLRERIAEACPDDAVIGEEEADRDGTSGRTWIVDPIDGTKAFTHGVPLYCNLVAVTDEHGPAVGVINLPALGQTVYAGRGLGCFEDGRPARVSAIERLADSHVTTSSYSHWPDPLLLSVKGTGASLRTWGDGYGYALVATGRVEVMIDVGAALWDLAPMPVILAEAGGRFSDFHDVVDPGRGYGVATNGLVHSEILGHLGPHQEESRA